MTTTDSAEPTPFGDVDAAPQALFDMLFAALRGMAAHPEIQRVRRVAWDALSPAAGQRLLDAGAGAGEVARDMAASVGTDGEVTAMESSARTLEAARALSPAELPIRFVRGDIEALQFPDATFDGVRAERVLQHLGDPDAAVRELSRVTRPGGRVCLIDTDWESVALDGVSSDLISQVRANLLGQVWRHHTDMGRTLRRRLVRAGLDGVTATPVTCLFPDPGSAAVVLPFVNPAVPPALGMIPDAIRDQWFAEIASAGDRGDFLAVLTIWVAVGTRPDQAATPMHAGAEASQPE
jgi:SAM-dependent methyltransferase